MASSFLWSVIIPTVGRAQQLEIALCSLCKQSLLPAKYEILVVNNGESDSASDEVVKDVSLRFPEHNIRLLHATPPGLLSGRHFGAMEANAPILTFVDDDIEATPAYAESILSAFESKDVHLVGGPCMPKFESRPPEWLDSYWIHEDGMHLCGYLSLMTCEDKYKEISPRYVWGLNFSIRKSTFFDCGGFKPDNVPEKYQMYQGSGEYGLTMQVADRGLKAVFVAGAKVFHIVPSSRLTEEYFRKRRFYQGVCDSYTSTRKAGKVQLDAPLPAIADKTSAKDMDKRIHNAYVDGWFFHQMALRKSPRLMEWVCKKDYWDYQYPELEAGFKVSRDWCDAIQNDPMKALQDPSLVLRIAMNYGKAGRIAEGIRATVSVEKIYPDLVECKQVRAFLLDLAGRHQDALEIRREIGNYEYIDCNQSEGNEQFDRSSISLEQSQQIALKNQWLMMKQMLGGRNLPSLAEVGFRAWSQFDEDGQLLYLLTICGFTNRKVVELCIGTGDQSNTTNLIINHACEGLLFDGELSCIDQTRQLFGHHPLTWLNPPKCVHAWITRDNINDLLERHGFTGEIDLLSLDVDGNDYWIWKSIEVISPRVFICEVQYICPDDRAITIPYKEDFVYTSHDNYHAEFRSASPLAMIKLSREKGYRLVGANKFGFNFVFLRNDIGQEFFPEVQLEEISNNPHTIAAKKNLWRFVSNAPWVEV